MGYELWAVSYEFAPQPPGGSREALSDRAMDP